MNRPNPPEVPDGSGNALMSENAVSATIADQLRHQVRIVRKRMDGPGQEPAR